MVKKGTGKAGKEDAPADEEEKKDDPDQPIEDAPME
jgi:hypothetical protein